MPNRARTYKTEAIVMRRTDIGEADRILTLLTPEHGKTRVVAKGIRKLTSRKAGHLELLTRVDLLIAHGRDLDLVTQAQSLDMYAAIRSDLNRLAYASYTIELLDRFTVELQEAGEMYTLLRWTLTLLNEGAEPERLARFVELKILELAGYQPELRRCTACKREIVAEDQSFSLLDGGVVCPRCADGRTGLIAIGVDALKYLRYFQSQPWSKIAALRMPMTATLEMEYVLQRYIVSLLERQLKSVEFLRLIRHQATA
jgi:DNA repair protein RecO (recombination protein O)